MNLIELVSSKLGWLRPGMARGIEQGLTAVPAVQKAVEQEYDAMLAQLETSVKPYRDEFPTFRHLPEAGVRRTEVMEWMETLDRLESDRWQDGYASGAVYHGDPKHINFLNRIYALHSQSNPLHADLWPSASKFEAEIVAMTAHMLGADQAEQEICGTVTSGGTESILLAMKTYRDWARAEKGIKKPEMIVPVTAHAAFEKASDYFQIKRVEIPVDEGYAADVQAAQRALTGNTIVIVGSAPTFPHGIIDPIAELSELARQAGIGFHTDACLGGFVLPWAEKLGYVVPPFDFRLSGVTSMSADTHKYGYAAKGTSVVLYHRPELRRYQYFAAADWPGGLYFSPTFAGSRPGALSATCWAAMVTTGEGGYMAASQRILETASVIREGIETMPELHVLGNPLWVIAFASESVDIYRVMDAMTASGWSLNGLHKPSCVHLCVTLPHTQPGVAERFLRDLAKAVDDVKNQPEKTEGMAPIYGMAATLPFRGMVTDLLKRYIDLLYKV
jgi:sphinganine-1-phosphate aldolase